MFTTLAGLTIVAGAIADLTVWREAGLAALFFSVALLRDFEATVSLAVWERVEGNLDGCVENAFCVWVELEVEGTFWVRVEPKVEVEGTFWVEVEVEVDVEVEGTFWLRVTAEVEVDVEEDLGWLDTSALEEGVFFFRPWPTIRDKVRRDEEEETKLYVRSPARVMAPVKRQ